ERVRDAEDVSLSGAELMTFIREERERELCLEGHRWFDLRRYQVDAKYPYSTTIEHTFTFIKLVDYTDVRDHTNYYRLEPNDDAYTLDIPKTVRDHQVSIGSNPRPYRQPFKVVTDYDDDDDY
ncbi:MAG: RagB/SusD family nutrient uptake outer membrane protein, partial [Prevotella sp.]|nr:RagB/SusD family nutrient uptake outer membrane protein [Prevotella sp.]